MNKIDFLKEWYYKEEDRKDFLNNSLNIPIGILSAIIAGIYFLINNFNYFQESNVIKYSFIIFISTSIILWIICIIFLILSYNNFFHGFEYYAFPKANFINEEEKKIKIYIDENKEDLDSDISFEKLLENNIEEILINCIDKNVYNNDSKSAYLHNSKVFLIGCIVAFATSSLFYSFNYLRLKKEETYNIKIVNDMSNKIPPPPPKPQPPRTIKESQQPTRPNNPPPKPSNQPKKK